MWDIKVRIGFKEQRRLAAENVLDYTKCDHLCEQIKSLRAEVRELEAEYKKLERKKSHSKWYHKRVSAVRGLSSDEERSRPLQKKRRQEKSPSSQSNTPYPQSSPSKPSTPLTMDK